MVTKTNLLSLLHQVAPEVADEVVGVGSATIDALEAELGIKFPAIYRAFLEAMGQETAGFAAMDPTHTTCFGELLAELPGPEERTKRYWRVSIERQMVKQTVVDIHLDLSTSDGTDAELVTFDFPPDDPSEIGDPLGLTFFEQLRSRMFLQYVATRFREHYWVYAPSVPRDLIGELTQRVRGVLEAEGLEEFARYPGRIACFRRDGYAAILRQFDETGGLGLRVEAPGPREAALLAEKVRDRLPDNATTKAPKRR